MELIGQIIKKMNPIEGEGKNGKWIKCDFVIETEEKFPKKVCLTTWGQLVDTLKNYNEGSVIKVQFDVSSREYNEKWYTDLKAWRFDTPVDKGEEQGGTNSQKGDFETPITESAQSNSPTGEKTVEDDLPF